MESEWQNAKKEAIAQAISMAVPAAVALVAIATDREQGRTPSFTFQPFRESDNSTVEDYFTRFKWALQLSKIPENQQADYARVHMGIQLNDALKLVVAPKDPKTCTLTEIETVLKKHYDCEKNKYAESVKFRHITQNSEETIASFALRLRQGAAFCDYGEFLDRMLTEQLIHGMSDRNTCDEIISKKPSTFKEAYEIVHSLESTHLTTQEVKRKTIESTHSLFSPNQKFKQNQVKGQKRGDENTRGRGEWQPCYGCGARHSRSQCSFKNATCYACNKKGHIAKMCKSKKSSPTNQILDNEDSLLPTDEVLLLNSVQEIYSIKAVDKFMLPIKINNTPISMELDTEAPTGIIGTTMFKIIEPSAP